MPTISGCCCTQHLLTLNNERQKGGKHLHFSATKVDNSHSKWKHLNPKSRSHNIHSSLHPIIHATIHSSIHPIHPSYSSIHPIHLFIHPSIPLHLFIHPSIHPSVHPSIRPIHLFIHPSIGFVGGTSVGRWVNQSVGLCRVSFFGKKKKRKRKRKEKNPNPKRKKSPHNKVFVGPT